MLFENYLFSQLRKLINEEIRVATGEELFTGILVSVDNAILRLRESTDDYERETRNIVVLLSEVSFIQVDAE
ncbi:MULTISPECIES: hypothetical protein [Bacillales]|uniref:DUF2642 domain-containing protein n=1 Tax=Lysinibacillus halotolerans TaxID=1368476 RepID=A0A3M8H600_9BACI|nr:hypothetical protein [Lysinibacillus halotolerans]RNC97644.1 hypothetical protein EC501_14225 [Lysinibacillus halotolerans]